MAPYLMFSFLLLTLLALTRYVTVARLFYDNALALILLSVALSDYANFSLCSSHWGTWSSDLALFSADSASLTVAIQLVLYRDHSIVVNFISCLFLRPFFLYSTQRCELRSSVYQFHSMPIHTLYKKVHFIGVHMNTPPFQFYVFLYFSFIISVFVLSGVTFINISAFSPIIMVLFILCWFAPKWHVRSI